MSESNPYFATVPAFQRAAAAMEDFAIIVPEALKEPEWQIYECIGCQETVHHRVAHQGSTPYMLPCACGERFRSKGRTMVPPERPAKMEWYAPGGREQGRLVKGARQGDLRAATTLDHIRQGGLMIRKIGQDTEQATRNAVVRETAMPGRNAKCPCGSERKFKHCCGKGNE